jgi:hypothetical protein
VVMPPPVISVTILGARELSGRFASMRDTGLQAILTERADAMGQAIVQIYANHAPRSPEGATAPAASRTHSAHFADSFFATTTARAEGFEVMVDTSEPDIEEFIRFGHGDIYPVNANVLRWIDYASGKPVYAMHVGPVAPNHWQEEAQAEVDAVVAFEGPRIGVAVSMALGGKLW